MKGDPGDGSAGTYLFGKLYAQNHLRADRWYKLGRELLYGRLEDEKPFNTVRRLVQQEDYALRMPEPCPSACHGRLPDPLPENRPTMDSPDRACLTSSGLTGGTGAYRNVGGEGTLVEFGNDKGSLTLHLLSFAPRGKGA